MPSAWQYYARNTKKKGLWHYCSKKSGKPVGGSRNPQRRRLRMLKAVDRIDDGLMRIFPDAPEPNGTQYPRTGGVNDTQGHEGKLGGSAKANDANVVFAHMARVQRAV